MNEIIERLKNNEKPNFLLTDEEFAAMDGVGAKNREFTGAEMYDEWQTDGEAHLSKKSYFVHRIKSTYQPYTPKLEVGEVYILKCVDASKNTKIGEYSGKDGGGGFCFNELDSHGYFIVDPSKWTFQKILTEKV